VSVAATVNMAGGQPISLENLRGFRELTRRHGIRVILDATRIAENACFIQRRESGQQDRTIASIVRETCELTDGCTMSAKVVIYEGLHTYGRMAGRDTEAVAIGLEESVADDHIRARVYTQVHWEVVAESIFAAHQDRGKVRGLRMVYEPRYRRFFQARFEPLA
jgi:tyrosine phenol-lyase